MRLLLLIIFCLFASVAQGQPIPDESLDTKVSQEGNIYNIEGGAIAGTNLFHSSVKIRL